MRASPADTADSLTARCLQQIQESTYTLTEAYRLILFLEQFLEQVRFGAGSHGSVTEALERFGEKEDKEILSRITAWNPALLEELAGSDAAAQLRALKDALAALPKLVLYIPAAFSAAAISSIGEWCRKHIDADVMLDTRVDPAAAGGCIFAWNDKLYDFSLRYFLEKRQKEFRSIIDSYAPAV